MATLEIFPTCYHMDHRTIPAGATCRFCKSPPYPGPNGAPSTPAETVTPAPLGLTDPPVPTQSSHLPHRPSVMVPDAATDPHSGLAGSQIRRTAFRPKLPKRFSLPLLPLLPLILRHRQRISNTSLQSQLPLAIGPLKMP